MVKQGDVPRVGNVYIAIDDPVENAVENHAAHHGFPNSVSSADQTIISLSQNACKRMNRASPPAGFFRLTRVLYVLGLLPEQSEIIGEFPASSWTRVPSRSPRFLWQQAGSEEIIPNDCN